MRWTCTTIGRLMELEYGEPLKAEERDGSGLIPVAGSNGVVGYHSSPLVKGPGIVVGRKGSAGKVTWFHSDFWPIDTTFFVRPKINLELKWLFYLLGQLDLERLSIVTGVPGLNRNRVYPIEVSLPPPREQRRIVELLEQADGLRRQRAEADQLADRILPALFHKMFGDPAMNPRGWPQRRLGEVITEAAYGTSSPSNTNGEGLPVLRMNNLTSDGRVILADLKHVELSESEAEKQMLRAGDLLFNRTNSKELVGKTGLWRGQCRAVAASYLIRVRVDAVQVVPDYVWAWMNTTHFKQRLFDVARRAVGMANINATELRAMSILVPDVSRQRAFSALLGSIEMLSDRRGESARQLDRLFTTLLHRAFTGELTAKWREAHLKELMTEMEQQARLLRAPAETK